MTSYSIASAAAGHHSHGEGETLFSNSELFQHPPTSERSEVTLNGGLPQDLIMLKVHCSYVTFGGKHCE